MRNVLNYFDGVHGSESYIVPRQPTRGYKNLKTHTRTGSTLRSDGLLLIKHNKYLFSLSPDAYIKSYKLRESIDGKKNTAVLSRWSAHRPTLTAASARLVFDKGRLFLREIVSGDQICSAPFKLFMINELHFQPATYGSTQGADRMKWWNLT